MTTTRRDFLKSGAVGAATVAVGTGLGSLATGATAAPPVNVSLVATDGWIQLPGLQNHPDGLYIFGFKDVPLNQPVGDLVANYKNAAQHPAPILDFTEGTNINVQVTNLGLQQRPDLIDSHTLHWHGFRTPLAVFDGVPEVSIAVPQLRQFTYAYRPHDPGTYMYHCHFEDVEHVQMGMTGIVFVRSAQAPKRAYDSGLPGNPNAAPNTNFVREFPILLNELWTLLHDNDANIQETIHTDYDPDYFTLNGRVYPQTLLPNEDPSLPSQPISSLVQVNAGDRSLLRLANLGYRQHAMQLPGIPMRVVGQDATMLRSFNGGADLSYMTDTLYMGPGEARDVIFVAPEFSASNESGTDSRGTYNRYFFRNHDAKKLSNPNTPGLGGMATEVRVYPSGTLPAQTKAGQTYA